MSRAKVRQASLELNGQPNHGEALIHSTGSAPTLPNYMGGGEVAADFEVSSTADDPGGIRATLSVLWHDLISQYRPEINPVALGPDVDFFAAGGTSILAVMMLTRIYQEWGVDVSFNALLQEPTIRALSQRIIALVLEDPDRIDDVSSKA